MRPATRGPEQREPGSTIDASALESFRASFRGELVLPSEEAYERARRVWNGAIDKRPAVIARCSGVVDVVRAVEFGREHELLVAVRGGGHNVAGHGTCDGGIVMDLSPMRGISLDLARRTIRVQAGATWGDVDHETQAFGLATTGGLVSTTGIAGFTLGGGFGWLMRKHGLACDNLLSAEIVSAGGRVLGAARGRRQLRNRDGVRVPALSRRAGRHGRSDLLPRRGSGRPAALLPRMGRGRTGRANHGREPGDRNTCALPPRGGPRRASRRRQRVLRGNDRGACEGVPTTQGVRSPYRGPDPPDPVLGDATARRRTVGPRPP